MRASIGVGLPLTELQPGKTILGLDGFVKTMNMIDKIAEKEIDEGYENHTFARKIFKKSGPGMMKVSYLYNVGRRRQRSIQRVLRSYDSYNSNNWSNDSGYISLNDNTGSIVIGNSGSFNIITGTSAWGVDLATSGSSNLAWTTYRITGEYS